VGTLTNLNNKIMKSIEIVKIEGDWKGNQYVVTTEVEGVTFEIETNLFDEVGLLDYQYIVNEVNDFLKQKGYEVYALEFNGTNWY
jgi:hypothetical protein